MSISANLKELRNELPDNVTLVAISKTHPPEVVLEAYNAGQRIFGENKAQELVAKQEALPSDIEWHMVGHLQTNKVKYIAPFVSLIHSVDSFKLLKEINKQAKKQERIIPCLLQMHIAEEDTKFGLDKEELSEILESEQFRTF
ncbi:MAG: YggS family pyridoxal phosphate-dependent enzyme, partial [Perlabentimonas sp.]